MENVLVKFITTPDEEEFSIKFDEEKIYLKIYVYDVTNLESDEYYELEEYGEDTQLF